MSRVSIHVLTYYLIHDEKNEDYLKYYCVKVKNKKGVFNDLPCF